MAQANHSSAGGNNKQFPSVSLKNTDSNRYGGGIRFLGSEFEYSARIENPGDRKTMSKMMTKSELIQKITDQHSDLTKKDVKAVMETLATVAYKELKKTGAFLLPGFAKFVVIKKPATKERAGINPFTKQPTVFKARPARKIIRARPVKAAKDAV